MDLINRFTNAVIFSAEVETVKELLLAAIRGEADLREADLREANLREANLREVNLRGANLREANLREANLRGANLREADLSGANLREADLSGANLRGADLSGANLRGADLYGADLSGADLYGADLSEANLREADLYGADLYGANAKINGHSVIQVNGLAYPILITDTHLRAGCQMHTFAAWRAMSDEEIAAMDGKEATDFYPVLIGIIDLMCKDREAEVPHV